MAKEYEKKVYSKFQLELAIRKLNISGNGNKYHCPFHKDKTPSMFINYDKVGYHCFSCGRHGNLFSLVRDISGSSIEELLNTDSFVNFFNTKDETIIEEKKEVPVEIKGTILPWGLSLEAQEYTKKRGIPNHICKEMNMGYLEDGEVNGTRFFKRLIIPTTNKEGVMINLEGRDTTFKATPKVLYPKNALKPIYEYWKMQTDKPLYLVEGLIKLAVLRSDEFFSNSTTTMGSYLSPFQENQLKKFSEVWVVMDNDEAGEKYYKRVKSLLTPLGKSVRFVKIKSPIKDVDEIPTKLKLTVREFRESGKFEFEQGFNA